MKTVALSTRSFLPDTNFHRSSGDLSRILIASAISDTFADRRAWLYVAISQRAASSAGASQKRTRITGQWAREAASRGAGVSCASAHESGAAPWPLRAPVVVRQSVYWPTKHVRRLPQLE